MIKEPNQNKEAAQKKYKRLLNSIKKTEKIEDQQDSNDVRSLMLVVFIFFLIHMAAFGGVGFFLAYFSAPSDIPFLYIHGGIAIYAYLQFYTGFFGKDRVKWIFINSALGIFGIYGELRWFLAQFNKDISDYSVFVHIIPFTYYVLYTFLLYQTVLVLCGAYTNPQRKTIIETTYVVISLIIYFTIYVNY